MRELIFSGYIDDYAWLLNYTAVSKIDDQFMSNTVFGFNPFTQWRYLSVTRSLYTPAMITFRHLYGTDPALVLSSQGFYIAILMISGICFAFLQFVIYFVPYEFESTSTAMLICTLINFVVFFIGSHFYGRWAGQLAPNHYSQGSWKDNKLPTGHFILLVIMLIGVFIISGGSWVFIEYMLVQWTTKSQFNEYFIKGVFGGCQFIVLKVALEHMADSICEDDLRESPRKTIKMLNYFKLLGATVVIVGYPIYYLWAKLFIDDIESEQVQTEFRYWIYGYAALVYAVRPLVLVDIL
jgi:hypothetical protein